MKRSTRMLLGISIALITAASLHFTVGHRFHDKQWGRYGWGHYGHRDCGSHSRWSDRDLEKDAGVTDQKDNQF